MSPDFIFAAGNLLALSGWVALLLSWRFPDGAQRVSAIAIPSLLALAYAGILLTSIGDAQGSFFTLEGIMTMFTQPMIVVMGWLHYLAFDLFVGAWIARDSRERGLRFALVALPLFLTLMVGPIGLLTYHGLLLVTGRLGSRPVPT